MKYSIKIANSRYGWNSLVDKFKELNLTSNDQIDIITEISDDIYETSEDITNLKYFLIIKDYLTNQHIEYKFKIICIGKDGYNNVMRIRQFFSHAIRSFYVDDKNTLYIISSSYADEEDNLNMYKSFSVKENDKLNRIIEYAKKIYIKEYLLEKNSNKEVKSANEIFDSIYISIRKKDAYKRNIYIHKALSKNTFINIQKAINKSLKTHVDEYNYEFTYFCRLRNNIDASDIFPVVKIDNMDFKVFDALSNIYTKSINNEKAYKGDIYNHLDAKNKTKLIEELNRNIDVNVVNENPLVKCIFMFLLRNYIDNKEIFCSVDDGYSVNKSIFDKIFADSKSYAEGLFQIIENSCLYSCGKCAYVFMRTYSANRNSFMSDYERDSKNRLRLYNKYKLCLEKNVSGSINPNNIFNDNYSDYLELCVFDNAINKKGILETYNSKNNNNFKAENINQVIEETEDEYKQRNNKIAEYYITHYGLRWFNKIIAKNTGCIMIMSPYNNDTSLYLSPNNDSNDTFEKCNSYYTEHNVLLPLSYKWQSQQQLKEKTGINKYLFGKEVSTEDFVFYPVKLSACNLLYRNQNEKLGHIIKNYNIINSLNHNCMIIHLDVNSSTSDIEICAKSLFLHIMKSYLDDFKRKLYIVVHFDERRNLINEFVRVFSIFYDKIGENKYMQGVEIALASKSIGKYNKKCDEVNFILSGVNFISAYITANTFVYYNAESSAEFVPLLKYLTKYDNSSDGKHEEVTIFPFDLYLKNNDESLWFIKKMSNILDCNVQNNPYGCKISNVHIRISSRLHLDTFYEAELLFHNISNVYRFAYIVAKDIINDFKNADPKNVIILGYENYSSILIQQIAEWVKSTAKVKVSSAIVTNVEEMASFQFLESPTNKRELYCYTIIPVGTTMSTVYKVHNVFLKHNKNVVFRNNYSLVCVSDNVNNDKELFENETVRKYWESIDTNNQIIKLARESANSDSIYVKYILRVKTRWHSINNCELCKNNIPLIQVDKTSTIPNSIFELQNNHRKFIDGYCKDLSLFMPSIDKKMNVNEIVKYAHLCRGNNHYQFYFNFQELVQKADKKIISWAKSIKVDNNAYNIVISPLSLSNTQFLKLVIDNVFSSSLRFLHIDINNTYKEDIRAKFSYISMDYKRIKTLNSNARICFYYVDDSIVTGQTINRARMFLKMIVEEANLGLGENIYFEKVFLLLNRSSYDTARTFVRNVEKDYCCFFNIEIPSYNTNSDFCPGCSIKEQYQLLHKRSASEKLSSEFLRLSKKHEVRTPEAYDNWISNQIDEGHNYFLYLMSYLYYSDNLDDFSDNQKNMITNYMHSIFKKHCKNGLINQYDKYIEAVNCININKYVIETHQEDDKYKIVNLVKYIIAKKAYTRLVSMNNAYINLSRINQSKGKDINVIDESKTIILKLMANAKTPEEIISLVKVISREHLSKYYHIRCAIVQIMVELLNAIISNETSKNKEVTIIVQKFNEAKYAQLKYHLIMTIIHRLAMLQTSGVLSLKTAQDVINYMSRHYFSYYKLINDEVSKHPELLLIPPSPKETMINQYMKSLKTATMLNNDDALCNKLLELSENLLGGNNNE